MNEETYMLLYHEAKDALHKQQLNRAFLQIQGMLYNVHDWNLHTEYEEIKQTYQFLLNFMRSGTKDPERHVMFHQLQQRTHRLVDELLRTFKQPTSAHPYYEKLRSLTLLTPNATLHTIQLQIEQIQNELETTPKEHFFSVKSKQERIFSSLFSFLWTSPIWKEVDYKETKLFFDTSIKLVQQLSISAITLSVMEFFDPLRLQFLIEAYRSEAQEVRQRALVGATFCLLKYKDFLSSYPEISLQLESLAEVSSLEHDICYLQMQLLLSLETSKAERKMREEIIPELIKNNRFRSTKFGFEEVDDIRSKEDINPEWKEQDKDKLIDKKLMEMAQMQQEGVDLYMGTFSQLKHFSFFQDVMNWFYPFDPDHHELKGAFSTADGKPSLMMKTFFNSGALCDSDKYSFCLMARTIPQEQREMMEAQISAATQNEQESMLDRMLQLPTESPDDMRRIYLQDLYRFFKLYRKKEYFIDPFQQNLYLFSIQPIANILNHAQATTKLAEFMMRHKYYHYAIELFEKLNKLEKISAEILQKLGYAYQMEQDYERAINCYRQSDVIKPHTQWSLRQLAQCYRSLHRYEDALACYLRIEELDSDNLQNLTKIGECYAILQQHDDAFAYFFKVDYLTGGTSHSTRAIAWCSFLTQKLDQAEKYYQRLLANKPKTEDYLNAAHTAWVAGDTPLAVARYQQFLKLSNCKNIDFESDRKELESYGIKYEDTALMNDLLELSQE